MLYLVKKHDLKQPTKVVKALCSLVLEFTVFALVPSAGGVQCVQCLANADVAPLRSGPRARRRSRSSTSTCRVKGSRCGLASLARSPTYSRDLTSTVRG